MAQLDERTVDDALGDTWAIDSVAPVEGEPVPPISADAQVVFVRTPTPAYRRDEVALRMRVGSGLTLTSATQVAVALPPFALRPGTYEVRYSLFVPGALEYTQPLTVRQTGFARA